MVKKIRVILAAGILLIFTACNGAIYEKSGADTVNDEKVITNEQGEPEEGTYAQREIILTRSSEYPESYLQEIMDTIKTVQEKNRKEYVSYLFVTDLHIDDTEQIKEAGYHALNAVVDVANNTDIDFVCVGGDLYSGKHAEDNGKQNAMELIQSISDIIKNCDKPVFILHGNHDDNSFSGQINGELYFDPDYVINDDEWYSVTMANFSQYAQSYHNGYFYYDIPGKNVRVVCLNMSNADRTVADGENKEIGMLFYGYKDEQIQWLLEDAFSRPDCRYYIMDHDAFDYPEGYSAESNREVLKNILAAAYEKKPYDDGKFVKDFSAWSGQLMLMNVGHLHLERAYSDPDTGGLPILNTDREKLGNGLVWGNFGTKNYSTMRGRVAGEVTETIFNVVISQPGRVDIVRFGAGDDYYLEY